MTSPGEEFVLQLSRASGRANRFLRVRSVNSNDRKDIIAAALLSCWENRNNYSLTITLDLWFLGAVRDAYKSWMAGEHRNHAEAIAEIPTGDTTLAHAEAVSSAQALMRALPREYRKVAILELQGYTRAEMIERGATEWTIREARERIKQLRKFVPDTHEYRAVLRTMPATSSDDATGEPSGIDKEIAALDFPPPTGKECPPCWRCKWFEGYLPGTNIPVRMEISEREVKAAVLKTERRKVRIAKEVRDGIV